MWMPLHFILKAWRESFVLFHLLSHCNSGIALFPTSEASIFHIKICWVLEDFWTIFQTCIFPFCVSSEDFQAFIYLSRDWLECCSADYWFFSQKISPLFPPGWSIETKFPWGTWGAFERKQRPLFQMALKNSSIEYALYDYELSKISFNQFVLKPGIPLNLFIQQPQRNWIRNGCLLHCWLERVTISERHVVVCLEIRTMTIYLMVCVLCFWC